MESYLETSGLWDLVQTDMVTKFPENPTIAQMRDYREERRKRYKAKTYIHSAVSEAIFTKIMNCETTKQTWDFLEEEYQGNIRTKQMQVLSLRKEFEMQKMKETEAIKDYTDRLLTVVNKIRLLGKELSDRKVVEKILVTLLKRFE